MSLRAKFAMVRIPTDMRDMTFNQRKKGISTKLQRKAKVVSVHSVQVLEIVHEPCSWLLSYST